MVRDGVSAQTRIGAIVGSPVRHSLSPAIHNAGFEALGLDWIFLALEVGLEDAEAAFAGIRALGIDAVSVTMPLKAAAFVAVDARSEVAERLCAVNCISVRDGEMSGHNTDGEGFLRGLAEDLDLDVAGKRVVVVGAGGAARAVLYALGKAGAADVAVLNRTELKAKSAAELVGPNGRVGTVGDLREADLVVQATSLGMHAGDPLPFDVELLGEATALADLIYGSQHTQILRRAAMRGLRVTDGRSMLLHQAAIAFELWTEESAPLDVMRPRILA